MCLLRRNEMNEPFDKDPNDLRPIIDETNDKLKKLTDSVEDERARKEDFTNDVKKSLITRLLFAFFFGVCCVVYVNFLKQ